MGPTAPAARLATRRALLCTDLCCFGCAPETHLPTTYAPCERKAHAHAQPRPLSCSGRCCTRAILVTSGVAWARRARAHAHTDLDVTARSRSRLPPRQMTHDPHVLARSSLPSRHPPLCYRRHRPCEPIRRRGNGQWFAETSHESIRPRCTEARSLSFVTTPHTRFINSAISARRSRSRSFAIPAVISARLTRPPSKRQSGQHFHLLYSSRCAAARP